MKVKRLVLLMCVLLFLFSFSNTFQLLRMTFDSQVKKGSTQLVFQVLTAVDSNAIKTVVVESTNFPNKTVAVRQQNDHIIIEIPYATYEVSASTLEVLNLKYENQLVHMSTQNISPSKLTTSYYFFVILGVLGCLLSVLIGKRALRVA